MLALECCRTSCAASIGCNDDPLALSLDADATRSLLPPACSPSLSIRADPAPAREAVGGMGDLGLGGDSMCGLSASAFEEMDACRPGVCEGDEDVGTAMGVAGSPLLLGSRCKRKNLSVSLVSFLVKNQQAEVHAHRIHVARGDSCLVFFR